MIYHFKFNKINGEHTKCYFHGKKYLNCLLVKVLTNTVDYATTIQYRND